MPDSEERIERFKDMASLSRAAAKLVADTAARCVSAKGLFTFAISGGDGPKRLLSLLAEEPFASKTPWSRTHIFQVDDRFVPYSSDLNNFRAAAELLLSRVPIPLPNIHRIATDYGTPENAAEIYEDEVRRLFTGNPRFDLIQLGMGDDGHTASLFPASRQLDEGRRWIVAAPPPTTAKPAVPRVTMTLPVLNAADTTFFIINGEGKLRIAESFMKCRSAETAKKVPASAVNPARLLWLCCG